MRKVLFGITCALVGACANSVLPSAPTKVPVAATVEAAVYVPLHDNIPATMLDNPGGQVYWLCATQPRAYDVNGHTEYTEDHYLQRTQCPSVPILRVR